MKFHFFRIKNTVLLYLTVILAVMAIVILKECTLPLVLPDKYFYWLICNPNADKTMYNIAISYVAAYIFYIIQVFIPECRRHRNARKSLQPDIDNIYEKLIYINEFFTKVVTINNDTIKLTHGKVICCKELHIYTYGTVPIMDSNYDAVKKMVDFYSGMEFLIDKIKSRILYTYLDDKFIELLSDIELSGIYMNLRFIRDFSGACGEHFIYDGLSENYTRLSEFIKRFEDFKKKPITVEIKIMDSNIQKG